MNGPRAGLGGMTGAALLVTCTVCIALLTSLATLCYMAATERAIPDELDTIVTGLILAATGLLAKTWAERPAGSSDEPEPAQPVSIQQPDGEPVPVVESPAPRKRIKPVRAISLGHPTPPEQPDA